MVTWNKVLMKINGLLATFRVTDKSSPCNSSHTWNIFVRLYSCCLQLVHGTPMVKLYWESRNTGLVFLHAFLKNDNACSIVSIYISNLLYRLRN